MASPQVVVVGSYVQDLCWKCERFPHAGQTIVGQFSTGPGGKGSNQAVAAGRTGVPTMFVGAVGVDAFAKEAKAFYKAEGIGAKFVEKPAHATGTAAILVEDSGQNEIVVALGANAALAKIGAIVHFLELGGTPVPEAAGVQTLLQGAVRRAQNDDELLSEAEKTFDLLYEAYFEAPKRTPPAGRR